MKKLTSIFLSLPLLISTLSNAAEIEISFNGSGTVKAIEANTECNENCTIINDLATNTLQAVATSGQFSGWSGQQCDAGSGVMLDTAIETLGFIPSGAKTLVSADINQDNSEDLAYISLFDGQVGFFVNEGNGNFDRRTLAVNLNYPAALAFYDWDNDNDADLLVTEYGANNIKLYSNNGQGDFTFTKDMRVSGYRPYAISVNDINQDNIPDLALSSFTANTGGNLSVLVESINNAETAWFINNGQDEFELATTVSNTAAITIDTYIDSQTNLVELVAAEIETGDIALYAYDIDAAQVKRSLVGNGSSVYGAAFEDIDNNGTIDVLTSHYQPKNIQLSYRKADGSFDAPTIIGGFAQGTTATAFLDIDNNGYKDLLTGEFNNNKFLYVKTLGYRDCLVKSDSKIAITANFEQQSSSSTPNNSNTSQSSKSESGGGGSTSFISLLIALTIVVIRKVKLKYR
ncbi:VCBS repeat-containing protein [Thalassotalea sp. M1531]|uniref:VCBS repeat-containing protein n=1 Tax=Thalassotalea algicola TaxID=2716224 RepID=A0A7Y0LCI8_9GAMM|nr:VCBS repeat-containing protein [Thalassotalea algicola]NMP31709.1 VCBS repeat-containing protein [Thalassotalea algicola]